MSMEDILNKLKSGELKADSAGQREDLPAGTYDVILKGATHSVGKNSQRDFLMLTFQIMNGEYAGRTESVFPNLHTFSAIGKTYNENYTVRQLALVVNICKAVGSSIDFKWLSDATAQIEAQAKAQNMDQIKSDAKVASELYEALKDNLQACAGRPLKMAIVEKPNRRNPQSPYRNYEFAAVAQRQMPQQPAPQPQPQPQQPQTNPFAEPQINNNDLPF